MRHSGMRLCNKPPLSSLKLRPYHPIPPAPASRPVPRRREQTPDLPLPRSRSRDLATGESTAYVRRSVRDRSPWWWIGGGGSSVCDERRVRTGNKLAAARCACLAVIVTVLPSASQLAREPGGEEPSGRCARPEQSGD